MTKGNSEVPKQYRRDYEAIPPSAPEAEAALLGCCLVDPVSTMKVLKEVGFKAEYFANPENQKIYLAILATIRERKCLDLVLLYQYIKDRDVPLNRGCEDRLCKLAAEVPNALHARYYCDLIHEKARNTGIMRMAGQLLKDCHRHPHEIDKHLQQVRDWLETNP